MKKKLIVIGAIGLLLGLPMTVSASSHWPGSENVLTIESNLNKLDELLTEKESMIVDLNQTVSILEEQQQEANNRIVQLEKEVVLNKETKDKAQAFDSVAQAIEKRTGFQVTVENYKHLMSKTIELLDQKNGIAKQLIKWVFG